MSQASEVCIYCGSSDLYYWDVTKRFQCLECRKVFDSDAMCVCSAASAEPPSIQDTLRMDEHELLERRYGALVDQQIIEPLTDHDRLEVLRLAAVIEGLKFSP